MGSVIVDKIRMLKRSKFADKAYTWVCNGTWAGGCFWEVGDEVQGSVG